MFPLSHVGPSPPGRPGEAGATGTARQPGPSGGPGLGTQAEAPGCHRGAPFMLTVDPGGGAWAWCSTWLPAAAWTGRAETPASRPLPPGADSGSKNSPELSGTRTPSLLGRSPRQVLSCCHPLPIFPRPWLWALAPGACAGRWGRSSSCPRPGVRSPEGPPSLRGRSCWELEQVLGRDGWGRFGRPGLTAARAPWTPSRRQEVTPAASRARGGGTQTPHWGPGSSVLTGSSPGRAGVPRVNWLSKPRPGPGRAVQGRAGEDCVPGGEGGLPGGGSQGPSRPHVCSRGSQELQTRTRPQPWPCLQQPLPAGGLPAFWGPSRFR